MIAATGVSKMVEARDVTIPAPYSFWCSVCDARIVKQDDPSTGKFFSKVGHIKDGLRLTEEYKRIVWAVCTWCLESGELGVEEL